MKSSSTKTKEKKKKEKEMKNLEKYIKLAKA